MKENPRIYLDSGPLIDLVAFKVGAGLDSEREKDAWHIQQLLVASRRGMLEIFTSSISVAECTHIKDQAKFEEAKPFFMGLLASGKSGIVLVQPTIAIMESARNLRWLHSVNLSGMDSIHAATALRFKCNELLHRDGKFSKNADAIAAMGLRVCAPSETHLLPDEFRQGDAFGLQ